MQTLVTVHLNIKGDPVQAKAETIKRLNEWFTDSLFNHCEPGRGFPEKTLLHYTVGKVHVVSLDALSYGR